MTSLEPLGTVLCRMAQQLRTLMRVHRNRVEQVKVAAIDAEKHVSRSAQGKHARYA